MPKALFLIEWDDAIGPELRYSYPDDTEIDIDYILQYLMTIQAVSSSNTIQLKDAAQNVLIYGIPSTDSTSYNYDFLILLLNEDEHAEKFQFMLQKYGTAVVEKSANRKAEFSKLAHRIFNPEVQKIVFMGLPNAGKTSTKLFFFQKAREEGLLNTTITPTQGFESSSYKFMDLNISMFDTSGQELERWFTESTDVVFNSDLVIFFFSVEDWLERPEFVKEELRKLKGLKDHENADVKNMSVFCHKIDMLDDQEAEIKNQVEHFTEDLGLPVFFTSIVGGGNQDLMVGLQMLITQFSSFFANIQTLLNELIRDYKFVPLLILNNEFRPVIYYKPMLQDTADVINLKKVFTKFMLQKDTDTGKKIGFMLHWCREENTEYGINFVDLSILSPQVSYLVLKNSSFEEIVRFRKDFDKIIEPFRWNEKEVVDN